MYNAPKWSNTLQKSYSICSICRKIFKLCLTILGHCALKDYKQLDTEYVDYIKWTEKTIWKLNNLKKKD